MELSVSIGDKLLVMDQIGWLPWSSFVLKYIREDNCGFCTNQEKAGDDGWHLAINKTSGEDDNY